MRASDFDYQLPPQLIAQHPASKRDQSRLLVLHRKTGQREHRQFLDVLNDLQRGDLLVVNNSKVIPARLRAINARTGGEFEVLLLEQNDLNDWWTMMRPGKRARDKTIINFLNRRGDATIISAAVLDANPEGHRRLRFSGTQDILNELEDLGAIPLPPYIKRTAAEQMAEDSDRYQTVYAETRGSVAAPTAGLHFTPELLDKIRAIGVEITAVTLHVGLATFAPVKTDRIEEHVMHEERYDVTENTAAAVNSAKRAGNRIFAVGTTSLRVLESAQREGNLIAGNGKTNLFVYPPRKFEMVDALLTNFHLPRSTLLMLVSAFAAPGLTCGRELILQTYAEAVREQYRFFSYGDAMLIL